MSAKISGLDIYLSINQIARAWKCDRHTARNRLSAADVKPEDTGARHPKYKLQDVIAAFAGNGEGFDPDSLKPFERKAHYQAEHEKLKLETERGELIPRIEVEQEQARILKSVSQSFDTLPDRFERDIGANAAQLIKLEQLLDECRDALYLVLIEAEDAKRAASSGS